MNLADQIAAEAWDKLDTATLTHHNLDGGKRKQGIAIIKSAIEEWWKSVDLLALYHNDARFHAFVQRMQNETLAMYKEHGGQSQQPQEWTTEMVEEMLGFNTERGCQTIACAHNATLPRKAAPRGEQPQEKK